MLARLFPDAYPDDQEAAAEFRRYTESGLRESKQSNARTALATLDAPGTEHRLTDVEVQAWLGALNDLRLALGTRLDVTEDWHAQAAALDRRRPRAGPVLRLRLAEHAAGAAGPLPALTRGPPAAADRLCSVLTIAQDVLDAIVAHARRDHPDEACGIVAGPAGSDRPERFVPMLNAARSPTFYEFDSGDLLRLYRDLDARDEEPVVVYHSHTATEAYPSRTDVALRVRAGRPLRARVHPGPRPGRGPLLPDRGRRGHRGRSPGRARVGPGGQHILSRRPTRCDRQPRPTRGDTAPWPSRSASRPSSVPYTGGEKSVDGSGRHPRRAVQRPGQPAPRAARAPGRGRAAAPLRQRLPQRRGRAVPRRAADARWPTATT